MTSHDKYLDELLHDAWIPLPPVQIDDAVVLQCHRDADKRRAYFRVTLTECEIRGFDDPEAQSGMVVMGVAINDGQLCLEGVEGAELRLGVPTAIKHVQAGSVDDKRTWTNKLGLRDGPQPAPANTVVPVGDIEPPRFDPDPSDPAAEEPES